MRRNPEWVATYRPRDLRNMAPLLVLAEKDPVPVITALASHPEVKAYAGPNLALIMDRHPELPVLRIWTWAYLSNGPDNTPAAKAKAQKAVKVAVDRGSPPARLLHALLAVLIESPDMIGIKKLGDAPSRSIGNRSAKDRREAFAMDVQEARERGVPLPPISKWEVDETMFYEYTDLFKDAQEELLRP